MNLTILSKRKDFYNNNCENTKKFVNKYKRKYFTCI